MGHWSAAIMGGDTAMDYQSALLDEVFGIGNPGFFMRFCESIDPTQIPPKALRQIRKNFDANINHFVEFLEHQWYKPSIDKDDISTSYQVLGMLIMRFGFPMNNALRGRIIQAALDDEWAIHQADHGCGDGDRVDVIVSFIDDVLSYVDGVRMELTIRDEGLLAAMNERIADMSVTNKGSSGSRMIEGESRTVH